MFITNTQRLLAKGVLCIYALTAMRRTRCGSTADAKRILADSSACAHLPHRLHIRLACALVWQERRESAEAALAQQRVRQGLKWLNEHAHGWWLEADAENFSAIISRFSHTQFLEVVGFKLDAHTRALLEQAWRKALAHGVTEEVLFSDAYLA